MLSGETQICALPIAHVGPQTPHYWFEHRSLISAFATPFFLPCIVDPVLSLTLVIALCSSLPCIARYRLQGIHHTVRADGWGPTNYRINWHYFSGLTTTFISPGQSDSLIFWQNAMADFWSSDFAVWEALASLKRCIEVILRIELEQSYCEILESVPAVFAKLSWNFHPSLCGCSALAGNRQYITGLSIYYRDMTCFDGLYLKKSCSACSILGHNIYISFGPNGAPLNARWWSTLRAASRSY